MVQCHTCELIARRNTDDAPLWDSIHRTTLFDVVHSYNTSLLGWLVLIPRRHIVAIADMTDEEALQLGKLTKYISAALQDVTGCPKTYVVQFAENIQHPHVHFHIIPRMADQPPTYKGIGIFQALGVSDDERITEAAMNEIANKLRARLLHYNV